MPHPITNDPAGSHTSVVTSALAANRLSIMHIVYFIVTAAAPLAVVAGLVSTSWSVTDVKGVPVAFLLVSVLLGLFCVGYVAVARRISNAGAFYPYVAKGLGRPLGVSAALTALLAYGLVQISAYGAIGPALSDLIRALTGVPVPWWISALAAWAFVAMMGVFRVDVNSRVLAVALALEVALVIVLDVIDLLHPYGGHVSLTTLNPASLVGSGAGMAAAVAITGFIGFEAAAGFSEESRDSRRSVPRATYISLAFIALLYTGSAWAMSVAIGPDHLHTAAVKYGSNLPFEIVSANIGTTIFSDIGRVLFLTSLLALALSYHSTWARYAFALGRERVLPAFLGRTSAATAAPKYASLTQSATALAVIIAYAIAVPDPLVPLFFWFNMGGGFGVLLLITATSIAVISYLARHRQSETIWQRAVAPGLAAAGMLVMLTVIGLNFASLLGVEPTSPVRLVFPLAYLAVAVGGTLWALHLRHAKPRTYAAIGLGAAAASTATSIAASAGRSAGSVSGMARHQEPTA